MHRHELPAIAVLPAGVVLLSGSALLDAERLVRTGIRSAQRDGLQPGPRIQQLAAELKRAVSMTPTERPSAPASITTRDPERIGTDQAAAILDIGRRQVQRIAAHLGGRRTPSGAWTFDAQTVRAEALRRVDACPADDIANLSDCR